MTVNDGITNALKGYFTALKISVAKNNRYEQQWKMIRSRGITTRNIQFDHLQIPPGFIESSWFPNSSWLEPHPGFQMFDGNLIIGSDLSVFDSPGLVNIKVFSKRNRLAIGPLSVPSPGVKTIIETTSHPFDLVSMDICPVDYNNLSLRFKAFNASNVELASFDIILHADTPKRLILPGFSMIHKATIEEFDVTTKTVHPEKDPMQILGVAVALVNIKYKLKIS